MDAQSIAGRVAEGGELVLDRAELERRQLLLLRQVVELRVNVDRIRKENRRGGDDLYGEQYNVLCGVALALFPSNPMLEGHLVKMPDANTMMFPASGTDRLLARISDLELRLSTIMGIDPRSLPESRGLSDTPTTQAINISNSTIGSVAANLKGTQIVTANQEVANQAPDLSSLLRQLRQEIESADADDETKFDALKDTESLQGEIEKKRPVVDRALGLGRSIGTAIPGTVDTVNKILDLLGRLQLGGV